MEYKKFNDLLVTEFRKVSKTIPVYTYEDDELVRNHNARCGFCNTLNDNCIFFPADIKHNAADHDSGNYFFSVCSQCFMNRFNYKEQQ